MIIKETDRLILRTWKKADITLLAKISSDPLVMKYFPSLQSFEATKALLTQINQNYDDHGYTLYALELKSNSQFIGFTGLMTVPFDASFTPAIEIGWRLAKEHWGRGYATEAAKTVLDIAFNKHGINELVSFTTLSNIPSQRVMQKIGFKHNVLDNFSHPKLAENHLLSQHVLYRLSL